MTDTGHFRQAWILSDGKVGDLVQCEGVARALGVATQMRIISPARPWVWFMPYGPVPPADRLDRKNSPIHGPLPDLLIASGWRTLAYIREIKKQQQDKLFTVFLKFPRQQADFLDLIWVPEHDGLKGEKIISSLASPHRFSPEVLSSEYKDKPSYLDNLPGPLVGVMLGGDSKDYHFSDEDCNQLAASLQGVACKGAGLAITPSRRTPEKLKTAIKKALEGQAYYWWDEREENPYGFILSHADQFIVTADSANMVGEVCVTGRPVYVFKPSGGSKKFDRLLEGFASHGATKELPEKITDLPVWSYEPLFAARDIAKEIERRTGHSLT